MAVVCAGVLVSLPMGPEEPAGRAKPERAPDIRMKATGTT